MAIDITAWLGKLGLEQYAPAFRDNAIDSRVLPRLTAEDLKDLGVTLVGHRRRLLEAIATLGAETSAAVVLEDDLLIEGVGVAHVGCTNRCSVISSRRSRTTSISNVSSTSAANAYVRRRRAN